MNQKITIYNRGFTLIEMMIVVAILGILMMFVTSSYLSYVSRVKVSELLNLAGPYKNEVVEYYAENGKCPNNESSPDGGFPMKTEINSPTLYSLSVGPSGKEFLVGGKKVASVCRISMVFRGENRDKQVPRNLKNKTIRLRMAMTDSGVYWQCSVAADGGVGIPFKDLPHVCRNT